ncbi:MAG: glycosyltransferase [Devosia sp.]
MAYIDRMSTRRPILMIIDSGGYGGAQTAFLRLARYMCGYYRVTVAVMSDVGDGIFSELHSFDDFKLVSLTVLDDHRPGFVNKIARWSKMITTLRRLKRDNIASISFLSGPNLLNALSGRSETNIVSERGSKRFDTGMSSLARWLWTELIDRYIYRSSKFIVAASADLAAEIGDSNKLSSDKLVSIEGGVNSGKIIERYRENTGVDDKSIVSAYFTICGIGRMHHQKGFDFLIDVFCEIRSIRPTVRLLLIGDGPMTESLKYQAAIKGLRIGTRIDFGRADVVFLGYQNNPLKFLKACNLFALPSRYEGLPNALIEALVSDVPIVAADCPWGVRSVLSLAGVGRTAPKLKYPVKLTYGTLLPAIDDANAFEVWQSAIEAHWEKVEEADFGKRRDSIRRFDIEATGPAWSQLIQTAAST